MGHAFFTLSIGMGAMMVYGSYLPKKYSIGKAAVWIVFADTAVALLAGVIIFTVVFGNGMEPSAGPGLLFQTLPVAFGQMSGGWFWGTLFFFLVVLAALSSAISLIEPAVSWVEQNWRLSRAKAAWLLGTLVWLFGIGTVLSFNVWKDVHFLPGKTFFDTLDFITANIMLPLGGMLMATFMAWIVSDQARRAEYRLSSALDDIFKLDLRYVAPIGVLIVFSSNLVSDLGRQILLVSVTLGLYGLYVYNRSRFSLHL
jgi:NSS family neurotransmitter:Na+ symporter